jgi:flavin reductase
MNGHDPRPEAFDDAFAPAPLEAVDQRLYREAMSRYGAAVHVITTDGSSGKAGFTATAVCSVTDDPPTLLCACIAMGKLYPSLRLTACSA